MLLLLWKAVTGEALFTRESGAVAAQFHDLPAIEPLHKPRSFVGAERGIVLGKKSGIDSIRIALDRLGLDVPADRQAKLLVEKAFGTKHQRPRHRHGVSKDRLESETATSPWCRAGARAGDRRCRWHVSSSTHRAASSPGFSHHDRAGPACGPSRGPTRVEPLDPSLAADDLHGQTVKAMRNVEVMLGAAGVGWDDVVRRTIYTTEPTAYEVITQAIDEATGGAEHLRRRSSGLIPPFQAA